MKTFRQFMSENVPTVAASSGAVAGIGVGPQGEPGVTKKKSPQLGKMMRRKSKPC